METKVKTKKAPRVKTKGTRQIVYIFKLYLDCGTILHKIGITSRQRVTDRLAEVLIGFFSQYRYSPRAEIKRFRAVDDAFAMEQWLHTKYAANRYELSKKFSGSTELFMLDEADLLEVYDKVTER